MEQQPKESLIKRLWRMVEYVMALKVPVYSAHACYFLVLSFFPTLVLVLALLRYTGLDVGTLTSLVEGMIPDALYPAAKRLILSTYQNTSGAIISLSAITALWSASRGMHGVLIALNTIYDVPEDRGYLYTRSVSVLYTFAFLLVLFLTLALNVFGTTIIQWLSQWDNPLLRFLYEVVDLRFFLLLIIQTLVFTAMFMVLPNRHNKFIDSLPGAILASCGWLIFSDIYSIYVENFPQYANIFGSVYAVALSMLWLYFCISIVFYGGAFNYYLISSRKREKNEESGQSF